MPIIGTAGWSISKEVAGGFSDEGSGFQRYASRFEGAEVNSTFYRRHRRSTFVRWARSVPERFRFALKMPRAITHERKLVDIGLPFRLFIEETAALGEKRGPLLCQLPPSLPFDVETIDHAFDAMRRIHRKPIFLEARHGSWASESAMDLLRRYAIEPVLADPALVWPISKFPEPSHYIRLHGKPKVYHSSYTEREIGAYAKLLAADGWCIFDNTATGAATKNALTMRQMIAPQPGSDEEKLQPS